MPSSRIILITGAAPYLGGSHTWLPLRSAASEFEFVEIDPMGFANSSDVIQACRQTIAHSVDQAQAIVAHGSAAKPVLDVLSQASRPIPALLLSPLLIRRMTPILGALRSFVMAPLGRRVLTSFARSKQKRLSTDRAFLKKQLLNFLNEASISDELLDEAFERVRNPNLDRAVDVTVEVFQDVTSPLQPSTAVILEHCPMLVGNSLLDRKTAARMPATVVPGVHGAPMIEAPQVVADAIRSLFNREGQVVA